MKEFLKRLSSRKFLLALMFGVLVFTNRYFELGLNQEDMNQIVKAVLGFIFAEGAGDVVSRLKNK